MKAFILLIVGLGVGFGGGIWYGVYHPVEAQHWTNQGQRASLQAQLKFAQAESEGAGHIIDSDKKKGETPSAETIKMRDQADARIKELRDELKAAPND